MKSLKITFGIIAAFMFLLCVNFANAQTSLAQEEDLFPDVQIGHEYYDQINYLNREEVFLGADDGNFYPDSTLNRAEFAAITVRLAGADPSVEDYNNCFPDVAGDWYAAPVCYAKEQGWVKGYEGGEEAGTYGPGNDVMDIEVLTILSRFNNWDTTETDVWYEGPLNYALAKNIYDAEDPILDITREKTADIIFRDLAVTALGNETYSDDLKADVFEHSLSELVSVEPVTPPETPIEPPETAVDMSEYETSIAQEETMIAAAMEDSYDDAFVGSAGEPQMIPCGAVFDPTGTEFEVTLGMQSVTGDTSVDIENVQILLYDFTASKWVYGHNSQLETTYFESAIIDDFSDKYTFSADEIYDQDSGEYRPMVHIAPDGGFLLEVDTADGQTYIVGDNDVNGLGPSDDFQNIADETTPNNMDDGVVQNKCPDVDVLGALQGAFTAEGVSVDTSNLDTSNFQSPMECGKSVSSTIRIDADGEVLPSHEEIARRVANNDIPEGGFKVADYLLVFSIYSYCNTQTWECEVILTYQLIKYTSGQIIEAGYEGYFDKDNLQGEFGKMLGETEAAISSNEGSPQQLH